MKLNLNDESIKENGSGNGFDPNKIFGYSVITNNTITSTLDNVILEDVITPTPGESWVDFNFKDSLGNTYRMREFEIDSGNENAEKRQANQIKRLKHMVTKFVAPGTQLPAAETFTDLCVSIKQLLAVSNVSSTPIRLKLVFNDKGYLSIPKYVPFMEPMSVTETTLKLDPGFDKLEKERPTDPAKAVFAEGDDDDLPF